MAALVAYAIIAVVLLALVLSTIRILREYERGVVFTLGRFSGVKGPGLILLVPFVQQIVRVDLRTIVLDVPSQDVISHDNVSVKVNAVLYFRVVDPERAVIQVEDFMMATSQLAQTTLRSVLGKHDLDEMLSERDKLNADIQEILDTQTDAWGIKVANVEIKHVDIDESMVRAIARQAEAERNRRARIINAEGEQQAAQNLVEAAEPPRLAAGGDAAALSLDALRHRRRQELDHRLPGADRHAEGHRRGAEGRRPGTRGGSRGGTRLACVGARPDPAAGARCGGRRRRALRAGRRSAPARAGDARDRRAAGGGPAIPAKAWRLRPAAADRRRWRRTPGRSSS